MASNQTPNLNLCQWEADDEVLRVDFNSDNEKIDLAVTAAQTAADAAQVTAAAAFSARNKPYVVGTYSGNGEASQTISLGFTPTAVLVTNSNGATALHYTSQTAHYGGLALQGLPAYAVAVVEGGFQVFQRTVGTNLQQYANDGSTQYRYIAFR